MMGKGVLVLYTGESVRDKGQRFFTIERDISLWEATALEDESEGKDVEGIVFHNQNLGFLLG
jgi:hypothetical protein